MKDAYPLNVRIRFLLELSIWFPNETGRKGFRAPIIIRTVPKKGPFLISNIPTVEAHFKKID